MRAILQKTKRPVALRTQKSSNFSRVMIVIDIDGVEQRLSANAARVACYSSLILFYELIYIFVLLFSLHQDGLLATHCFYEVLLFCWPRAFRSAKISSLCSI